MSGSAQGLRSDFLKEYAEGAVHAIDIALREWHHLDYTTQTLFATVPDLDWVISLPMRQDRSKKVDAFVSRFGRLQDHLADAVNMLGSTVKQLHQIALSIGLIQDRGNP